MIARLLAAALSGVALLATTAEPLPAARFAFLKIGATQPDECKKLLGDAFLDYHGYALEGEIDVFIAPPNMDQITATHRRANEKGKKVDTLRVMEWRLSPDTTATAKLVFKDDTLFYAIVPTTPSEATPAKLEERYGRKPVIGERERKLFDVRASMLTYAYADEGVAYLMEDQKIERKVLFAPVKPPR